MLKYVTNLAGDRCRGCQTMIHSNVLVVASQTWELNLLLIKKEIQNIQKFKVILFCYSKVETVSDSLIKSNY